MMQTDDSVIGPINIGNPGEFTILQLAEMIIKMTSSKSEIVNMPLPKDDPIQRKPVIEKANEVLGGWKPKVNLEDGLIKTIDYFKNLK